MPLLCTHDITHASCISTRNPPIPPNIHTYEHAHAKCHMNTRVDNIYSIYVYNKCYCTLLSRRHACTCVHFRLNNMYTLYFNSNHKNTVFLHDNYENKNKCRNSCTN